MILGPNFTRRPLTWQEKVRNSLMTNPQRLLALSFAVLMLFGGYLLTLPWATLDGSRTPFIDALFVAVSCVSVTGLTTVDTFHHWSIFGQTIMILLIQIGGLGTMTFTTFIFIVLRRRVGLENKLLLQEDIGQDNISVQTVLKQIAILTFGFEFIGGVAYTLDLYPYFGYSAIYYGFYQAISTFCNAGFVFFDNDLPYKMVGDWGFTLITCSLILIGGFGYMASFDIWNNRQRGFAQLTLHTKVMLVGELILVVAGTLSILGLEWTQTLAGLPFTTKIQGALFQAITPRTAGIPTLNYADLHPITVFITVVLMFIGAGPNSTGGGIKIGTMAVLWATSRSLFTNTRRVEIFERSLSQSVIYKAVGIVFFSSMLVVLATFVLAGVESFPFLDLLFEVTSAFATVGLTIGITPELSTISKLTLIIVMYTGRIGVLTLIGAFFLKRRATTTAYYPEDNVLL